MPLKQTSKSSKNVLLILAMALFIVALSLVILSSLSPTQRKALSLTGGSYADGYNAARDQAMKLGIPTAGLPTTAAGKVLAVNGDSITVQTNFFVDEKVDGVGNSRTVTLAPKGIVKIQTQIKPEDFAKKQQEFAKTLNSFNGNGAPPTPPTPINIQVGQLSDIAVGDVVSIQAGSDIHLAKEISATEIDVTK